MRLNIIRINRACLIALSYFLASAQVAAADDPADLRAGMKSDNSQTGAAYHPSDLVKSLDPTAGRDIAPAADRVERHRKKAALATLLFALHSGCAQGNCALPPPPK